MKILKIFHNSHIAKQIPKRIKTFRIRGPMISVVNVTTTKDKNKNQITFSYDQNMISILKTKLKCHEKKANKTN